VNRQPTLKGTLLELRPLRAEDWKALFAVASDPLVWQQHPDSDRYKEDVFRKFFDDAIAGGSALVAIERATGDIVGSSRYHGYDADKNEVEIGWSFLARRLWGGTYNREMKHLMLTHAFESVENVVFLVGPKNTRSRKAMEKIGGVLSGTRANALGRESVVYRITRSQFRLAPLLP
jgi:RimJ/RimL family protein N-acetyltransferase